MAIRIRFPAEDPPVVELTSYPLTELALSLHTVADPRMQPRLAPFVRRARSRLPKQVSQDLSELAFLLGPPAPAPFAFPEGPPVDVPEALAAISPRDEDFQWSLSMHVDGTVPERLRPKGDSRAVLDELQRDPDAVAGRLLQLFQDYWTYAFSQEWPDVEARLALARTEAELQLASGGIGSLLSSSTRRARLSEGGIAVTPTIPAEFDVAVHEDGRMPVVISLFSAPWVITRIMPAAGLVLPAPGADGGRVTAPSIELVQELDAIADPTRLTLLRLVAAAAAVDPRARAAARAERGRDLEAPAPARRRAARARRAAGLLRALQPHPGARDRRVGVAPRIPARSVRFARGLIGQTRAPTSSSQVSHMDTLETTRVDANWHGVELRHLIALRAVAAERSFSAAARSLGYTQSAVSGQILALERLIGARLFVRVRGTRPLELTRRGAHPAHARDGDARPARSGAAGDGREARDAAAACARRLVLGHRRRSRARHVPPARRAPSRRSTCARSEASTTCSTVSPGAGSISPS